MDYASGALHRLCTHEVINFQNNFQRGTRASFIAVNSPQGDFRLKEMLLELGTRFFYGMLGASGARTSAPRLARSALRTRPLREARLVQLSVTYILTRTVRLRRRPEAPTVTRIQPQKE